MQAPPLPQDETQRLQALLDLNILDTAAEERFDRITRLAARLFDVPVSLISLIDADRQWFKSRVGVDFQESARSSAFCAHAILQDGLMVVEDARQDERFASNHFVVEADARFYAGYPLAMANGSRIGTLCILDSVPRQLDDEQRMLLRDLAAVAANEFRAIAMRRLDALQREHDDRIASLLAHMPDGVLMLDADGMIVHANPAAERIFDAAAGGLQQRHAAALLGLDAAGLSAMPDTHASETVGRRLGGGEVPLEVKVAPMLTGQRKGFAAIVRDVTRERDLEQRNRATDERRRKHFTTATHELRTPMASILGFSELLLKREFDPATSRELVDIIHRQATRIVELINQLLDLARIEAGGVQGLQLQPLRVNELLEQTMAGLNGLGQNHRIRIELEDALPALADDAQKLQQALTNILSNSIKYSSEGSQIDIGARAVQLDGRPMVAIRVADRGIGMTGEQQARIFDAFYRTGQSPNVQGSGLGMTIFKEIVELHGGRADIESQPGAGTTVTVWLPVEPAHG